MVLKKRAKEEKLLTEAELELMTVIWGLGECTVKDVQSRLPEGRDLAYTSVATIMKILEAKGFLSSQKKEKAHVYSALVPREEYEAKSLRHMTENLFHGDPTSMVAKLLDDTDLSREELKSIRALLDARLRK